MKSWNLEIFGVVVVFSSGGGGEAGTKTWTNFLAICTVACASDEECDHDDDDGDEIGFWTDEF